MTYNEKNYYELNQNERQYIYIKVAFIQQKIYLNYKKKRMNQLISEICNVILVSYKETWEFDFFLSFGKNSIKVILYFNIIFFRGIKEKIKIKG